MSFHKRHKTVRRLLRIYLKQFRQYRIHDYAETVEELVGRCTNSLDAIEIDANTVNESLINLITKYPNIKELLCNNINEYRIPFHHICIKWLNIKFKQYYSHIRVLCSFSYFEKGLIESKNLLLSLYTLPHKSDKTLIQNTNPHYTENIVVIFKIYGFNNTMELNSVSDILSVLNTIKNNSKQFKT